MKLTEKLRRLLLSGGDGRRSPFSAPVDQAERPEPVQPRVFMINHAPTVPFHGGRRLHEVLRWHDPQALAQQYIADVAAASYGYAQYQIVERIDVDEFPIKADGFRYDAESYLFRWHSRTGFHYPDQLDYGRLLQQFNIPARINANQIDEVWLFGFPYAGYYESVMVGPAAFWCNAPPIVPAEVRRRFVIMGFNYERGVGEMLENLGHRAESMMAHVYRRKQGETNLWERFTRYDKTHPGRAECGNVHFAPNSERDYDWGNGRFVPSLCDDWFNFPNFQKTSRQVNCDEWGNGDMRYHHLWWLGHMPHVNGKTGGILNNWWAYIIDPNLVK